MAYSTALNELRYANPDPSSIPSAARSDLRPKRLKLYPTEANTASPKALNAPDSESSLEP